MPAKVPEVRAPTTAVSGGLPFGPLAASFVAIDPA
jgi:hypothetical protein